MKKTICLVTLLCLLLAMLSACGGDEPAAVGPIYAERGEVKREPLGSLSPAADASGVLNALAAAGQTAAARWQPDYAETPKDGPRLNVNGETSGETAVTDGAGIYMVDGYGLISVSAAGTASEMRAYTKIERPGEHWGDCLYLWKNQLAVVWTALEYEDDGSWQGNVETKIVIFSVADPAAPKQLSEFSVDGGLVDAVLLDGTLCMVTQKNLPNLPQADKAETILPQLHENGKTFTLQAGEIYLCQEPARAALTVVAAIRLEDGHFADALAFTDGTDAVCAEGQNLYLARTRWSEQASAPHTEASYSVVDYASSAETEIKRLKLDGYLSLADGCVLYGALSDPGAMDAWNGQLRIATEVDERSFSVYTDDAHGWTNCEEKSHVTESQLTVLDENLAVVGALARLGGEGGVASCAFLRSHAWITAGDTLTAVDLTNPAEPKICGSFAAAGETLLLRTLGNGCVLAFSIPAAGGKTRLTAYDVTDPANPKQLDSKELDAAPAGDLTARGTLIADAASGLIGWPAAGKDKTEYRLVHWTGSKLSDKGSVKPEFVSGDARTLLLNGLLYVCSPAQVSVIDPDGLKVVATVSNAVG